MDSRIFIADHQNSVVNQFLFELRNEEIQQDRLRFRHNLERMGTLLGYEISKFLDYENKEVQTPLGSIEMAVPSQMPVIISILRAGLPFHDGILKIFDRADNGFISAYRHHISETEFEIRVQYHALPDVNDRIIILADPMIATGASLVKAYETILEFAGKPSRLFIVGLLASEEGLDVVKRRIPNDGIFLGAVDKELTAKSYIVPGLGDAGDLAFGLKL